VPNTADLSDCTIPQVQSRNNFERMPPLHEVRSEYDQLAEAYDMEWADYLRRTTEPLMRLLDPRPRSRLLDVGCGTGALLRQISTRWPAVQLYGIDPSGGMLRQAHQTLRDRARLIQGEVTALPFAGHSFSVVVSTSTLRYWPDAGAGMREIARVLEPEGQLLLLDWCGDAFRHRLLGRWLALTGRVGGHIHRREELKGLLSASGFSAHVECIKAGWYWRLMLARATLS
jgi:SAM-dependent methyltransferase